MTRKTVKDLEENFGLLEEKFKELKINFETLANKYDELELKYKEGMSKPTPNFRCKNCDAEFTQHKDLKKTCEKSTFE